MTDRQTDRPKDERGKTICLPTLAGGRHNVYYHTSHKFAMLKLHRPEGENSYYHPAIISTITCAALMRVQFVSVRRFISMTALSTRVFHHIIS